MLGALVLLPMHALSVIAVAGLEVHGLFLDQCSLQNTAYPKVVLQAAADPTIDAKKQKQRPVDGAYRQTLVKHSASLSSK